MNRHSSRIPTIALGLALAFAAAPAAAHADTFCVHGPCPSDDQKEYGFQQALDLAAAHPGLDRIEIGAGTLSATNVTTGATDNPVEIVGAGSGAGGTHLLGAKDSPEAVLRIRSLGSSVSGVRIQVGAGTTGGGLALEKGNATHIEVGDAPAPIPTTKGNGVVMGSGTNLSDSRVVMTDPTIANLTAVDVTAASQQTSTVEDVELSGSNGLVATGAGLVQARRLNVFESHVGIAARNLGRLIVANSVAEVNKGSGATALQSASSSADSPTWIQARGLTLVGNADDDFGVAVSSQVAGAKAKVELGDSILDGFTTSVWRTGAKGGDATAETLFSDYDPGAVTESGPGKLTGGANLNVDPGFVDRAAGNYALREDSPLIEAGNDYPFDIFQGDVDLAGNPRMVDNDHDGSACADIGAFEYQGSISRPTLCIHGTLEPQQPQQAQSTQPVQQNGQEPQRVPPPPHAAAKPVSGLALSRRVVRHGARGKVLARFTLADAATVRLSVERKTGRGRKARFVTRSSLDRKAKKGKNAVALTGRLAPARLAPGTYRVAAIVRDAAGNRSVARYATFRVTAKR